MESLLNKYFFVANVDGNPGKAWARIVGVLPNNMLMCFLANDPNRTFFIHRNEASPKGTFEEILKPLSLIPELRNDLEVKKQIRDGN